MSMQCRACAAKISNPTAKNMFNADNTEILHNMEVLTGVRLKEDKLMPKHICSCCHLDLYYSIAFRERCLKTENYLQHQKLKSVILAKKRNAARGVREDNAEITVETQTEDNLKTASQSAAGREGVAKEKQVKAAETATVSNVETELNATEDSKSTVCISFDNSVDDLSVATEDFVEFIAENPAAVSTAAELENSLQDSPAEVLIPAANEETNQRRSSRASKKCTTKQISENGTTATDSPVQTDLENGKTSPRLSLDDSADKWSTSSEEWNDLNEENGNSSDSSASNHSLPPPKTATKRLKTAAPTAAKKLLPKSVKLKEKAIKAAKKRQELVCDLCGHRSNSQANLKVHILRHKGERNFKCSECNDKFYAQNLLDLHIQVKHRGEQPFPCRHCEMRFNASSSRHTHENTQHIGDFKFECETCNKKFATNYCLNKHEAMHTELREHSCTVCNMAFNKKHTLQKHFLSQHHQKKLKESEQLKSESTETETEKAQKKIKRRSANAKCYICDLCGHQSESPTKLDIHIRRHKGERIFKCGECGSGHYSEYLLNLHIRVKHRGEKPFACKYCGQCFPSGSARLGHEKLRHIRDFKYECTMCGKKFLTKSCLSKHSYHHTGLRPFRCDLCNVAFPRRPSLNIHCRTKQHQMRENEAQNNQLKGITTSVDSVENVEEFSKIDEIYVNILNLD